MPVENTAVALGREVTSLTKGRAGDAATGSTQTDEGERGQTQSTKKCRERRCGGEGKAERRFFRKARVCERERETKREHKETTNKNKGGEGTIRQSLALY